MTCTFFGHRDAPTTVKPLLQKIIKDLIEQKGVTQFYVGNQGNFDAMTQNLLADFAETHPIRYEIVLAYLPKKQAFASKSVQTLLPEDIETVPPRFAIEFRNKWMIEHSDVVVTYVTHNFGGAAKFKSLAGKKGKTVIELSAL